MSALAKAVVHAGEAFSFQRAAHHGWRRIAVASIAMNAMLAAALVGYIQFHSTVYVTLAATSDGRVIAVRGLDEPVRSDAELGNWVVGAVTDAYTLGHHDWQRRLADAREDFSDRGYEKFVESLDESKYLPILRDHSQVATAVAEGAPRIVDRGMLDGERLGWKLQFPMLVTFRYGKESETKRYDVEVVVGRVPFDERPTGLAIEWVIAKGVKRW